MLKCYYIYLGIPKVVRVLVYKHKCYAKSRVSYYLKFSRVFRQNVEDSIASLPFPVFVWRLWFTWLGIPFVLLPAMETKNISLVSQPALFATEQLTVKFPEGNWPPVSDTSVAPSAWQLTLLPSASLALTLGQITLTVVWFSGRQSFWSSGTVNVG